LKGYQSHLDKSQHKAFTAQTQTKKIFESVALQRFQKFSWFGFERKAL
jgi:hypothetical protein